MGNIIAKIQKFSATAFVVLGLALVNLTPANADSACETTDVSGPYGGIIDTCDTSISEGQVLILAAAMFTIGIAFLVVSKLSNPDRQIA